MFGQERHCFGQMKSALKPPMGIIERLAILCHPMDDKTADVGLLTYQHRVEHSACWL